MSKLNSKEDSKRIARNIFIALWEDRHWLPLDFSLSLHLCKEVRKAVDQCINNKLNRERNFEQDILNGISLSEFQKAQWSIDNYKSKEKNYQSALVMQGAKKPPARRCTAPSRTASSPSP